MKIQEKSHDLHRSRLQPYTMESSRILQDGWHHLPALLMSTALGPSYREHQAGGSQDHVRAVLVGTACPCSVVGRSKHHAQKKPSPFSAERNYLEKLFVSGENALLPRPYSVCAGMHTQFTSRRQVSLLSPASAISICLTSSQKPLKSLYSRLGKKGGSPRGPASLARHHCWQVPLHPTQADVQMTWSAAVGWASVETSFPH